jgi:SP family myo-inositol transporter-like MFS transporter 13
MADTAAEPLISNERGSSEEHEDNDEELQVQESALVSPGLFIWTLTFCAGVSGLLFGYEYVLISPLSLSHSIPTASAILYT